MVERAIKLFSLQDTRTYYQISLIEETNIFGNFISADWEPGTGYLVDFGLWQPQDVPQAADVEGFSAVGLALSGAFFL